MTESAITLFPRTERPSRRLIAVLGGSRRLLAICAGTILAGLLTVRPVVAQASRGALAQGTFAITDVSVLPMTSGTVLEDTTVLVRDGRIVAVGPSRRV